MSRKLWGFPNINPTIILQVMSYIPENEVIKFANQVAAAGSATVATGSGVVAARYDTEKHQDKNREASLDLIIDLS